MGRHRCSFCEQSFTLPGDRVKHELTSHQDDVFPAGRKPSWVISEREAKEFKFLKEKFGCRYNMCGKCEKVLYGEEDRFRIVKESRADGSWRRQQVAILCLDCATGMFDDLGVKA